MKILVLFFLSWINFHLLFYYLFYFKQKKGVQFQRESKSFNREFQFRFIQSFLSNESISVYKLQRKHPQFIFQKGQTKNEHL